MMQAIQAGPSGTKRTLDHQDGNGSTVGPNNNNNNNKNEKRKMARLQSPTISSNSSTTPITVLSLPLNIWLIILRHVPLRHVLTLASVSREFMAHVFNMPEFWIHVQSIAKSNGHVLPNPKDTSVPLRGLACRQLIMNQMTTMCDYCYTGVAYTVQEHGHLAVLPIRISSQDTTSSSSSSSSIRRRRYTVYLCGHCRIRHYQLHPEPVYVDTRHIILAREEIAANYCLPKKDIKYLLNKDDGLPRDCDAYIRLYARCIFGGDIGIEAEKQREQYIAAGKQ